MRFFRTLSTGLFLAPLMGAQQPAPTSAADLVAEVSQSGAQAEALAVFCTGQTRSALQTNAAALAQWRERNRWSVIRSYWVATPALETTFNTERASALAELKQHPFKAAFTCGALPNVLRSEKFDPSVHRGAALLQLVPSTAAAAEPSTPGREPVAPSTSAPRPGNSAASELAPPSQAEQTQGDTVKGDRGSGVRQLTAGEATFTIPPGWQIVKSTPDLAMLQFDKPHDGRTLLLITATPLTRDLREAFLATVRSQFPGSGLTLKYPHEATTSTGIRAITVGDAGTLNNARRTSAAVTAVGVETDGRLQTALMLSSTSIGEQITRKRDLETLVSTWQLRSPGPQPAWNPLHPPAGSGGLSGLWFGSRMMNQLNPLGGMDLLAVREYVVLFPDGRAYSELPEGGHVLDMDFPAACRKHPKSCGTYTLRGGAIHFQWAGDYGFVSQVESPLQRSNSGASFFEHDGASVVETKPVHALRLSGQYTSTFAMSGSTAAGTNTVSAQTFIHFAPDGTFQKSGFSAASFSNTNASSTVGGHHGVESGRYTIEGYTLTLQSTGQAAPEQYTIVFEAVSESPKAIFINDKAFLR